MLHERDNDVWPFPLPAALPIRPWIKGAWVSAQAEESLQTSWGRAPPWQEHSREGEGDPSGLTELHPDTRTCTQSSCIPSARNQLCHLAAVCPAPLTLGAAPRTCQTELAVTPVSQACQVSTQRMDTVSAQYSLPG